MATTYTVVKGDTLSEIAVRFGTTVGRLVALNDISDPDYIVVGQVLKIDGSASTPSTNTSSKPIIKLMGVQSNSERNVYVTWTWDKEHTENYKTLWYYDTGDGVWFVGEDSTSEYKQSVYTAPVNAKRVKFKVKAVSKTHVVNDEETTYWTCEWSTEKLYYFTEEPPAKPSTPTIDLKKYNLTVEINNLLSTIVKVQFQIVKDNTTVFSTGTATVKTGHAMYSCTVTAGSKYKARCRVYNKSEVSDWSDYTDNIDTIPAAPTAISTCKANSESSVYLAWPAVTTATSYELEYTNKKEYLDGSDKTTIKSGIESTQYELTGLETGQTYFFRVRATNAEGSSSWSSISSISIGKDPAAPTTWSSTTTAVVGEPLILYWVHNAEDGSSQTYAELELIIAGDSEVHTIKNSTDEDEKDKTSSYSIDTIEFDEGAVIQWRVRTAGVTKVYGDWSIQRTIDIYAPPTLELSMTNVDGDDIEDLEAFPFYIKGLAGPNTQLPIGYHLTITANSSYETTDSIGNFKIVNEGEQVYSKYFDISDTLLVELSAGNVDLKNNISYTVTCTVSMNSGLTAESSKEFIVAWTDLKYEPNAEIAIDKESIVTYISPYCEDQIDGITLAVYRREFDGTFVEIASGIINGSYTFVTDPHPSLDYARYRIVATDTSTGSVSYCDLPGYPVGEKAVIIQWAEEWTRFETSEEDKLEKPAWSGSLLKLPYNIDVTEERRPDVALIEYIGRAHPISYYGTQRGESAVWTMEIPKTDKETLYALRRLSIWQGDVYVREPSGSGYWANVVVSFSQKHCETTIPVSLSLTRVEGGM